MAIVDILSSSFLISLGITILLIGLIGMYFSQKIQEQDHKITSMIGVVSTMADEVHFLRNSIQQMNPSSSQMPIINNSNNSNILRNDTNTLIHVSDDDTNSDSESDDTNSDSVSESDSESDSETDSDDEKPLEIMSELINITEVPSIKVINMSNNSLDIHYNKENLNEALDEVLDKVLEKDYEYDNDETDDDDNDDDDNDDDDLSKSSNEDNHFNSSVEEPNLNIDKSTLDIMNLDMLKTIHIQEDVKESSELTIDFKKMSLIKLRELVIEKGLTKDSSKMKKPELIKLLE